MDRTLKKLFDFQHFRQKDRLTAVIGDVKSRYAAVLSDDEAELVSAAGTVCVPTEQVDVLLGRHDMSADEEHRQP